ncbi:serine hydrolase domain-containing protein [Staphylococcus pasteuri]|uniref:serine hydrolase domain-containing protein n=1 Tax=Staphylococcus pasteuri TaxID=45972 RepID=UPI00249B848F|nr:serine hydrolase domain-containing protein [Staphylococcus pasteuri]MDI3231772.1 serine hydrolase domain-containing protein [Staphylococcus pasteuri]
MKKRPFIITLIFTIVILIIVIITKHFLAYNKSETLLTKSSQNFIDTIVQSDMKAGDIPGASILIVKDNKVFLNKGYGYANVEKKIKAKPTTKYEIASNTKAFTGYAILDLAHKGKLHLNDKVSKYIPGFYMTYNDKKYDITIKQLLGQKSGIPSNITSEDQTEQYGDSINNLVNSIKGKELNHKPGDTFEYSNMNYDVLGLVIQNVSKESYQTYITENILKPLHMNQTSFKTTNTKHKNEAVGYEQASGVIKQSAPSFNIGDTPSAYLMSNTRDLEHWVKMQLSPSNKTKRIVNQSHQTINESRGEDNANGYAAGWFTNSNNNYVYHIGTLDNYSSIILLNPKKSYGIVILANLKSTKVSQLVDHLNAQVMNHKHYTTIETKIEQAYDINIVITILSALGILISLYFIFKRLFAIKNGLYKVQRSKASLYAFIALMLVFVLISVAIYLIPYFVLGNNSWSFVMTWLPTHAKFALFSFYGCVISITILLTIIILSKKSYK